MLAKGRYRARQAEGRQDLPACQSLRHLCFIESRGGPARPGRREADAFDPICTHVLVEEQRSGKLVACFRLLPLDSGAEISRSYAAQYYELSALAAYAGPMVEMGRFCIHPDHPDPDILRMAWGAMTQIVEARGVEMVFGCSSFHGTDAEIYLDAFAVLSERHLAPGRWGPKVKAPDVVRFADKLRLRKIDLRRGMLRMPPLLKTYLLMGGWVSDHAVVDHEMNTLHVFTGLEIGAIPPARAKALRAVAG